MATEKKTILVVDDDRGCRESLRLVLRHEYGILSADGGPSGLEILEAKHVDLLITGIRMPHMCGVEFLGLARENYPDLPVLILAGFNDLATALKCIRLGAFDYIPKPPDVDGIRLTAKYALTYPIQGTPSDADGISQEVAEAMLHKWHNFKMFLLGKDNEQILSVLNEYDANETLANLLKAGSRERFLEKFMVSITDSIASY